MLDAVGELADPPLHPLERRSAQGGRGEEVAHFLGLPPDALECFRLDRRRGEAVDLAADGVDLTFEPGGGRLRVMGLERRAQFGGRRLERREQRFALADVTRHVDPRYEIADRAFERDHRVARRKVGEALAHGGDFGAHGADFDGAAPRIGFSPRHVVKLEGESANVVAQRLRQWRCGTGFRNGARRARLVRRRPNLRSRRGAQAGRSGAVRLPGGGSPVRPNWLRRAKPKAGVELLPAHGDLRRYRLQIELRLRRRRIRRMRELARRRIRGARPPRRPFMALCETALAPSRPREAAALRLAGLSRGAPLGFDRLQPLHGFDRRLPIAVLRPIRALEDSGHRLKGARGPGLGAREPHLEPFDRRIKRVRNLGRFRFPSERGSAHDALEASRGRVEPIVLRFVALRPLARFERGLAGDRFVKPIVKTHAGATGGFLSRGPSSPPQARDCPRHRSVHVLDHRRRPRFVALSRGRRRAAIVSAVVVKKRLRAGEGRPPRARGAKSKPNWSAFAGGRLAQRADGRRQRGKQKQGKSTPRRHPPSARLVSFGPTAFNSEMHGRSPFLWYSG